MKFQVHRQSIILISISVFMIGLVLLNVLFIYTETKKMENDGNIITQSGTLRGTIQRIAKKEISGYPADAEIEKVRQLFDAFLSDAPGYNLRGISKEIAVTLTALYETWKGFLTAVDEIRIAQTERNKLRLYHESELLWDQANRMIFLTRNYAEQKLRFFRLVFVVFGINIAALFLIIWVVRYHVAGRLEHYAHYDILTGAYNKNTFNDLIEREIDRSKRNGNPFSIITIDLDHFKDVNDSHGHKTGDKVLQGMSRIVRKLVRRYDLFCRTGGEEFTILLSNVDKQAASALAERIRAAVEGASISGICVSVSLGVAQYDIRENSEEFFARADRALYRAKQEGRNRVCTG
jgi:diguanylate cyclase (GGDEF)-like protein